MPKRIYLSPSNQDSNMYAYGGTNEMEQCNRIADYAKLALERCGFEVKKAPKGQEMRTSIAESNAWGANLHIPIHTNASTNSGTGKAGGTVVFVYNTGTAHMKFAEPIYNRVQEISPGTTDYGVQPNPGLAELNSTIAMGIYIEVDFHDNPPIAKWIIENSKAIGEAICKGVCNGYGVDYIPESPKTVYRVQVGAFTDKNNAEYLLTQLKQQGYKDAFITNITI